MWWWRKILKERKEILQFLHLFPFLSKSTNMTMRTAGGGFDFKAGGKSGAGSILTFTMFFFPNFPLAVRPYGWLRRPPRGPDTAGPISQAVISPSFPLLKTPQPPLSSYSRTNSIGLYSRVNNITVYFVSVLSRVPPCPLWSWCDSYEYDSAFFSAHRLIQYSP